MERLVAGEARGMVAPRDLTHRRRPHTGACRKHVLVNLLRAERGAARSDLSGHASDPPRTGLRVCQPTHAAIARRVARTGPCGSTSRAAADRDSSAYQAGFPALAQVHSHNRRCLCAVQRYWLHARIPTAGATGATSYRLCTADRHRRCAAAAGRATVASVAARPGAHTLIGSSALLINPPTAHGRRHWPAIAATGRAPWDRAPIPPVHRIRRGRCRLPAAVANRGSTPTTR